MLALGIDTSSDAGSVGLVSLGGPGGDDGLLGELNLRSGRTHSRRLLPSIHSLLETAGRKPRDLDLLAVAVGPGSFTGLRIGMATAKGLSLALDRPLLGFSTLETIAKAVASLLPVQPRVPPRPICVLLDAGRGEVYRGLFESAGDDVTPVLPEIAIGPGRAMEGIPDACVICGSGVKLLDGIELSGPGERLILPGSTPFLGATLAYRALAMARTMPAGPFPAMTPNYLRLSDAEMTLKG